MSIANHKKNENDFNRNSLVVESIKIIKSIKPRFFVFENVPASTIPLSGTSPTTSDSTSAVSYDFLGKTIVIVEKDDLGENVSTEQTINVSSRPGEVKKPLVQFGSVMEAASLNRLPVCMVSRW